LGLKRNYWVFYLLVSPISVYLALPGLMAFGLVFLGMIPKLILHVAGSFWNFQFRGQFEKYYPLILKN
jgi:hypothetical protein